MKYSIPDGYHQMSDGTLMKNESHNLPATKKVFLLYLPLIVVIVYILMGSSLLTHFYISKSLYDATLLESWMMNVMGLWFMLFALFKLIDLTDFADGYATYDTIAKHWKPWGHVYPFVELLLGVLFLTRLYIVPALVVTILVLSVASLGVIQSILKKKTIQCACLGTIFKAPLTSVTLIENLAMVGMAFAMLILFGAS